MRLSSEQTSLLLSAVRVGAPHLLDALVSSERLDLVQVDAIEDSLIASMVAKGLGPDDEPNRLGAQLDDIAGEIQLAAISGEAVELDWSGVDMGNDQGPE